MTVELDPPVAGPDWKPRIRKARLVREPLTPNGQAESAAFIPRYKNLAVFLREYQPISYTLEGILPSSVFYFLTARRSTGKTAFLIAALFAIILGNNEILSVKVKKGRVVYIALENPTDLRMKA
jgi:hypothetical protein